MNEVKLTTKQFSIAWNKKPQYVGTYVARGKIIRGSDKLINLENPVNKLFVSELIAKGDSFDLLKASQGTKKPKGDVKAMSLDLSEFQKLELDKKMAELERIKSQVKLNEIKIKKANADLIPFESAKFIFIRGITTFEASFKAITESILRIAMSTELDYSKSLKQLHNEIHTASNEARETLLKEVNNLAKESAELLERGQKAT